MCMAQVIVASLTAHPCAGAQPGKHGAVRCRAERDLWGEGGEDVVAVCARGASPQTLPPPPA